MRATGAAQYDALVIGAGVNGLAAAATLARAGRQVLVLERGEAVGGQGRVVEFSPGFRADPLATDAGWLPPPVAQDLELPSLERVVPRLTVASPAGDRAWLALASDPSRAAEAIRRFSPADAAQWPGFVDQVGRLAGILEALYVLPPLDIASSALADLLPLLGVARKIRGLGRANMIELLRIVPMSIQEVLDDRFEGAALKALVGAQGIQDIRQGPRSGGTAFVFLHQQTGGLPGAIRGRGFWASAPDALSIALAQAARRLGVTIRTGAEVAGISVADDRATGVVLAGGEEISASSVLSTADPARTLLEMVDPVWLDPEFLLSVRNIKFRGSSARVLFALDGLPDFPGLPDLALALTGVLSLSGSLEELERAADAAKYGQISPRPHVELEFPSLRWPGMAPQGSQVAVARVQWAPYRLRQGDWSDDHRDALGRSVTEAIAQVSPGFERLIRERVVLTPPDLQDRYGVTEGALTQGEMTLDQILFMRPVAPAARYETPVAGLYLAGAGSHPGGGIGGGAGWLAARQLLRNARDRGRTSR